MSALEAHRVHGPSAEEETTRLFDAHSEELLAFCRRQLGSRADADDALQTTFLYVLRALRRGVVPECESAWLTTIAKNVCHTQRRTLGRRGALATDLDLDRIALAEPEPGEAELLAALPAALATLPDSQRNAIVMREWLGLRPGEIAARMELTTTATNALLTRARHSLAAALTASVRGPLTALNVGVLANALRGHLKVIFGSAASKTAVAAAVATVSVGGVVAQQWLADGPAPLTPSPIADQVQPAGDTGATAPAAREANPRALSPARGSVEGPTATGTRQAVRTVAVPPTVAPTTASTPVEPTTPNAPGANETPSSTNPSGEAVPDPELRPVPGLPPLPPLPDLSSEDPSLPPAPLPPQSELPPVELPPVETPELPPQPPLP